MSQRQKHCKLLCFGLWQAPKNQQKSAKKCPKWTFQGKQQALFLFVLRSLKASKTQSEGFLRLAAGTAGVPAMLQRFPEMPRTAMMPKASLDLL